MPSTEKPRRRAVLANAALANAALTGLPQIGAIIVPFSPRAPQRQHLTVRDRMSAANWDAEMPLFGYDRLVIHNRMPGDPPELGDMLLAYRTGEPWAAWGFARDREVILAWACATGADIGRFRDLDEALTRLLCPPEPRQAVPMQAAHRLSAEPIRLFPI